MGKDQHSLNLFKGIILCNVEMFLPTIILWYIVFHHPTCFSQMSVEVLSVTRGEDGEVLAGYSGDNIKLKIKGVEEEVSCSKTE